MIQEIERFFPALTDAQKQAFATMMEVYPEWNSKINVVSRRDIDNLEVHHLLHSLAIAKFISFTPGTRVLDLGSGGGFPGLPLAVMFPDVHFFLIDRIGKKIRVAQAVAEAAGIQNVSFMHGDSGEFREKVDFTVSRAVMPQVDLVKAVRKNISAEMRNALPNGVIALKGGELAQEAKLAGRDSEIVDIHQYFPLPYFDEKKIVYTPVINRS